MEEKIIRSCGNVFMDLGCDDPEIMLAKSKIVSKIQAVIEKKGMTKIQAAANMGISLTMLSEMFDGHYRSISEGSLRDFLALLTNNQ